MTTAGTGDRARIERRLAASIAVTGALARAGTLDEATPDILRAACEALGTEFGALWRVDGEQGVMRCVDVWTTPEVSGSGFERLTRDVAFPPGIGLPGQVWAAGSPVWVVEVTADPLFQRGPAAAQAGIHSGFAFPIVAGEEVLGVMEFFSRATQEPDDELLSMLGGMGGQIGQFIVRKEAEAAVVEKEARKSAVLASALDSIVTMDHLGRVVEFNPAAERTFGYLEQDVIGRPMADVIVPPSLRARHWAGLARYLQTGETRILDARLELPAMRSDGTEFPAELTVTRVALPGPPLFTAYIRDLTQRRRAEEERARAERGLRLLAEASEALAASLDIDEAPSALARLVIKGLADWCVIDLLQDGSIRRVAAAHADPRREHLLRGLESVALDPQGSRTKKGVLQSGRPEFFPEISPLDLAGHALDPEPAEILEQLDARSAMVLPLAARRRMLGVMTLVRGPESPRFDDADLALADELARRAALHIDNARLYRERDYIARTLQQSLLPPEVPRIPGIEVAARFRPAGAGTEVGGDFYDLFDAGQARWVAVMGDVCGKGAEAAALTGLARYTVRAAAMQEARPSGILATLNEALLRQPSDLRFCTVCCVRVARSGRGLDLTVSSGGHPLPFVVRGDGTVEEAGRPGTLLGVFPDPELVDDAVSLEPADALVLYTDGVIEERAGGVSFGEDRLQSLLRASAGCSADELADRISRAVADFQPDPLRDDVAVLVLRVPSATGGDGTPR